MPASPHKYFHSMYLQTRYLSTTPYNNFRHHPEINKWWYIISSILIKVQLLRLLENSLRTMVKRYATNGSFITKRQCGTIEQIKPPIEVH